MKVERNIFRTSLMQNEKSDDTKRNPLGERCDESVQNCLKAVENGRERPRTTK